MKILQTRVLKILPVLLLGFALSFSISAAPNSTMTTQADSLFKARQYTQSYDLYHQFFLDKKYSQATLLKMAFIQEGRGHLSESLYFLNLYYLASGDEQALTKVKEVAKKNNLQGYETDETALLFTFMEDNFVRIVAALVALSLLFLSLFIYQQRTHRQKPIFLAFLSLFFLGLLFLFLNFSSPAPQGIISSSPVYLMKGPSAGSSVAVIVQEGHQLKILGHKDVWLKVGWREEEVFIKKNQVLVVGL